MRHDPISAVLCTGLIMMYTRWRVHKVLNMVMPRKDVYIGCTESLALVFCFQTLRSGYKIGIGEVTSTMVVSWLQC